MSYQSERAIDNVMPDLFARKHIDDLSINEVILLCKESKKGRSRLCMHSNSNELLHCMLICLSPLHSVIPHRNRSQGQIIYIACKGEIQIKLDNSDEACYYLSQDHTKACAVDRSVFRTVKNPTKEYSVFWEITLGPHDNSDTIWKKEEKPQP